ERRGQGDGQSLRRVQAGEIEARGQASPRRVARECGQQVALDRKLLLQGGQRQFGLRQCRFRGGHIHFRNLPRLQLSAQQAKQLLHNADDLLGGIDLATDRRFLHGRQGDVGG